ncbi:hypothetical protein MAR_024603 [Mya arenaria]|uniref:Uncharacterized protein n=1 Tax=Mya arenaria TaxID=6604 RepID=A0ABY7DU96_MYAAR|nr:hypothetical protein MAR_024603 [Mya arenaria]
MKMVHGTEA